MKQFLANFYHRHFRSLGAALTLLGLGAVLLAVIVIGDTTSQVQAGGEVSVSSANSPIFVEGWTLPGRDFTVTAAWADVDGDGDLDLFVGNSGVKGSGGKNRLYLNHDGRLTEANSDIFREDYVLPTQSVAWGDVDGDGDLDLFVGNGGHYQFKYTNRLYLNNLNEGGSLSEAGSDIFSDVHSDITTSVAWGDVDGDGDLDLFVGSDDPSIDSKGSSHLYYNLDGHLRETILDEYSDTANVEWGDVDNDGDLDLYSRSPDRLFLNKGGKLFEVNPEKYGGVRKSGAWGDVDNDGDLDLLAETLFLSDGKSLIEAYSVLPAGGKNVAWGDVDGDGDLDLFAGNLGDPSRIYINQTSQMTPCNSDICTDQYANETVVAWGDVDGDGDMDLFVGTKGVNRLYINRSGHLAEASPDIFEDQYPNEHTNSVAWGDLDGDWDMDLFIGNDKSNKLYINTGGRLTEANKDIFEDRYPDEITTSAAWGDVDGDGDLDLFVGNVGSSRLYINQGGYLPEASKEDYGGTRGVAWGDMDNDGDLDLFAVWPDRLYLNSGGSLTKSGPEYFNAPSLLNEPSSVAWGDLDGDGDLDLFIGSTSFGEDGILSINRLFLNNGGHLTEANPEFFIDLSSSYKQTTTVSWLDIDGDGDMDLFANGGYSPSLLYNNQSGHLFESGPVVTGMTVDKGTLAWGDVDGDGDLDLYSGNSILINRGFAPVLDAASPGAVVIQSQMDPLSSRNGADFPPIAPASFYAEANIRQDVIPIRYTLLNPDAQPMRSVHALYSLNGGGAWITATLTNTLVSNLSTLSQQMYVSPEPESWEGASVVTSSVTVTRSQPIVDLDVWLNITHTQASYLEIVLVPPSPLTQTVTLIQASASNTGFNETILDDQANTDIAAGSAPFTGHYRPVTPLSILDGADISGTWTLQITDQQPGGIGTLLGWALHLNRTTPKEYPSKPFASLQSQIITSAITVSTTSPVIDVDVLVNIPHTLNNPTIQLVSPTGITMGITVTLADIRVQVQFTNTRFSDQARNILASDGLSNTGIYKPVDRLAVLDGENPEGIWTLQVTGVPTDTADLGTWTLLLQTADGGQHVYNWDVNSSGFFGQSDNVVFRIEAYPNQGAVRNGIPGPFQRPFVSTQTYPFRVQGNQIRVVQEIDGQSEGVAEAIVYQTTAEAKQIAVPILTQSGQQPLTDPNGYLPGRGSLAISDTLAALWPKGIISATTPTRSYLSHTAPISVTKGTTVTAQLTLTETRRIGDLSLSLGITHTQGADLFVTLTSPGLTSTPLITGTQKFTETYLSLTLPVDTVQGEMAGGDWTLKIENRGTEDAVLDGWGLETQLSNLYYSSAAPSSTGLKMVEVQQGGVQTLTVSADNPLYLFDLDVALEWDARNDPQYLSQLAIDLRRASEYLFDWTNGGLALGKIRVFHDAKAAVGKYEGDPWLDSHIRIYATNRLRPSAAQGGIVTQVITDPVQLKPDVPVVYGPGQVQIGATWNRFGDSGGNLGEDWPRILAHELGHYLLFLDDNYLGINSDPKSPFVGLLDSVTGCSGAMADPYADDQTASFKGEFFGVDDVKWIGECENTLSNQQTGRSDWETILTFYPELAINSQGTHDAEDNLTQIGPSRLPLAVTTVEFVPLGQPVDTLDIPIFYLTDDKTKTTAQPGEGTRAFLFTGTDFEGENNWINDLGRPRQDQVLARGAAPGDSLCVFDPTDQRQGCVKVSANAEGLVLKKTVWQPDVTITPLGSNQITVTVTAIPNGVKLIKARIYPTDLPASQVLSLTVTTGLTATTVFSLEAPAASGYVHVWIADNPDVAYPDSVITDFSVGGTPEAGAEQTGYAFARARAGYAFERSRTGFAFARGRAGFAFARGRAGFAFARARTGFGYTKARYAPAVSTDGQVILFKQGDFPEGQFVTIQSVLNVPKLPEWATLVGHAYRLVVSSQDIALSDTITDTVISFGYLGNEVPAGEELWLKIYHLEDACVGDASDLGCWMPLETAVDMAQNQASAKVDGPGIYAMFSTVAINLEKGWNLIGYPVQGTRLVTEALDSIAGAYSVVYGFDKNSTEDPWNVYIPGAELWASDLKEMRFGQGYLIYIKDTGVNDLVLRIKGNTQETQTLTTTVSSPYLTSPPAVYYGTVTSQVPGFTVAAGMTVTAYVDEVPCGEGAIEDDNSSFVVKVRAATEQEESCGAPNHPVSFRVASYSAIVLPPLDPAIERTPLDWDVANPHGGIILAVSDENSVTLTSPVEPQPSNPVPQVATDVFCQNVVHNGNFDTAGGWAFPLTPSQARVEDLGDGQRVMLLGVSPQDAATRGLAYSTAYQDILIPYRISSATLTFDYRSDGQTGDQGRFLQIQGLDRSVKMTEYLTGQADLDTSQSFDLTPYRGTWVRLFFQVTNDGRTAPRWMTVDNVSLQVCE